MKILQYNTFIALLISLSMLSCKEVRRSIEETIHPKSLKKSEPADSNTSSSFTISSSSTVFSSTPEQSFGSVFERAAALDSIQQALQDMPGLKGKKLFFLTGLNFYDYRGGMITIDLQDPDKPENVDTYVYSNGAWEKQKPVKIITNSHFSLKMQLMPLDDIEFSTAKKVYDIAVEKSKTIEGARPIQFVYFNQLKVVHVKEWYVMIRGDRQDYRITFDVKGNLMQMKRT